MPIVKEVVNKTMVGDTNSVASASSTPDALEIFKTVIAEAHALRDSGEIEIVEERGDRVRFRRLK
jgi:hypothetical protein